MPQMTHRVVKKIFIPVITTQHLININIFMIDYNNNNNNLLSRNKKNKKKKIVIFIIHE
jgi:hypothetical protein